VTTGRRLVINADDFGLSEGVNRGILEAHHAGSVTSTSLLVNLPAFADAVRGAGRAPRLGVGLHFNLTAGSPVAPAAAVPSLCDPATGRFHPLRRLIARALTGRIAATDVLVECAAQVDRFRASGLPLTHLDSHRHVHLLPGVWEAVMEVSRRRQIAVVRVPFDRLWRVARTPTAFAEQMLLRMSYRLAGGNGGPRPVDHFQGSALFAQRDFRDRLLGLLDHLDPGVTELMVHPGYADTELAEWDTYREERERELAGLCDAAVRGRLAAGDIELLQFGALGRPGRGCPHAGRPRFSFVIPAFNEASYLPGLLESIASAGAAYSADPDAVETIVVDNMSTDQTGTIAERGCSRVLREPRRIISAVRNTGAAAARGDVLLFVDADSKIHPETLIAIERALASDAIIGGATGVRMDRRSAGIAVSFALQSLWARITGWDTGVVFCRRADFDAIGGWDEQVLFGEDVVFFRALSRLARQRGQRFVRLRGVKTVTSARKFEQFGQWGWPLANVGVIWLAIIRSPRARRLIERYWYKSRA
jgi:predicted glycoside hydrolase/deacetylase ChbG (UPF0249 family)